MSLMLLIFALVPLALCSFTPKNSITAPPVTLSNFLLSRESVPTTVPPTLSPSPPVCEKDIFFLDRVISIQGTTRGENLLYFDPRFNFFKLALGWNARQIEQNMQDTFDYFRTQFGVEVSNPVFNATGGYYATDNGIFGPVIFDVPFAAIADSDLSTPCRDRTGILGGWAFGNIMDVTYGGKLAEVGVPLTVPGQSGLYLIYLVTEVGTTRRMVLEIRPTRPLVCPTGSCIMVGETLIETVNDAGVAVVYDGNYDGVAVRDSEGTVLTFTVSFPVRDRD